MKKLAWKTIQKTVNELVPQDINPRIDTDKFTSKLTRSINKYGLVEIPAIDADGKILAGHQRMKVLKALGRGNELIDCRVPNRKLTEKEAKEYMIASNKITADWDFALLKEFEVGTLEFAGFDPIELSEIFDKDKEVPEEDFDVEEEKKKIKNPKTKLDDLITLGSHRVLCGDATDKENLKRLFGDDRASLVLSDPVYNLNINYDGGISGDKNYGGSVNDSRTYEEYKKFLKDSMEAGLAVCHEDTHVFYYTDQIYIGVVQELYRSLGITNKRVCIWLKNIANPVHTVYCNKVYEPAVYGVRGKPYLAESTTDLTEVLNKEFGTGNELLEQVDDFLEIWTAKRLSAKDYEHATSKPPQLHEKAIKRCTKINDIILDSFLGSGSTLVAGEMLGRRVYGTELEPVFCDLIVRRWEKLTGKKAVYEKDKGSRT